MQSRSCFLHPYYSLLLTLIYLLLPCITPQNSGALGERYYATGNISTEPLDEIRKFRSILLKKWRASFSNMEFSGSDLISSDSVQDLRDLVIQIAGAGDRALSCPLKNGDSNSSRRAIHGQTTFTTSNSYRPIFDSANTAPMVRENAEQAEPISR